MDQKQTFSLILIVGMHCLLWFKVQGLQRHSKGWRFPPSCPRRASPELQCAGFGEPRHAELTLKVPEILCILFRTRVVLTVVLDLWSMSNQFSVWSEVKIKARLFQYKYPAVEYQLCKIPCFPH